MSLKRSRHALAVRFVVGVGALLALSLLPFWADRDLPRFEGKSARQWFAFYHRELALSGGDMEVDANLHECRRAFVEMGAESAPFLVREMLIPRRDTAFRLKLHNIFMEVPRWAGRGAFPPDETAHQAAMDLLRAIKPPLDSVFPLIRDPLRSTNVFERGASLYLLGLVGEGAEVAASHLARAYADAEGKDPHVQTMALQSLQWLGAGAAAEFPKVIASRRDKDTGHAMIQWAARIGPGATSAVPMLETLLAGTNFTHRIFSAIALLRIQPEHPSALRTAAEAASNEAPHPQDPRGRSAVDVLCDAVFRLHPDPHPKLGLLLEPLMRAEMEMWSPNGGSWKSVLAMQQVAPQRCEDLLRNAFKGPGALFAAGLLLRQNRNDPEATAILVEGRKTNPPIGGQGLFCLGEASSSNQAALAYLQGRIAPPSSAQAGTQRRSYQAEMDRTAARAALARIRYREARAARGLPALEW